MDKLMYKSYPLSEIPGTFPPKVAYYSYNNPETCFISKSCQIVLNSIRPVLRTCQIIGILPIQFIENKERKGDLRSEPLKINKIIKNSSSQNVCLDSDCITTSQCPKITCNLKSRNGIVSLFMSCHLCWMTLWVIINITKMLGAMFQGTDLYTFSLQIQIYFIQALVIVINGICNRTRLVSLYKLITNVYHQLVLHDSGEGIKMPKHFNNLKIFCRVIIALSFSLVTAYTIYFYIMAFRICFIKDEVLKPKGRPTPIYICPFENKALLAEKITYSFMTAYHHAFSILFGVFCIVLSILQTEIAAQLKVAIIQGQAPSHNGMFKDEEIERLRVLHAQCNKGARLIGSIFGFPILATCVNCIVSITSAIYTCAMGLGEGVGSEVTYSDASEKFAKSNNHMLMWLIHGFFGFYALFIILISGSMVQNSAEASFQVIDETPHHHLSDKAKFELSMFSHRQQNKAVIRALNVSNISVSFLAATATNVTTYILVLLQFRLGVDKS